LKTIEASLGGKAHRLHKYLRANMHEMYHVDPSVRAYWWAKYRQLHDTDPLLCDCFHDTVSKYRARTERWGRWVNYQRAHRNWDEEVRFAMIVGVLDEFLRLVDTEMRS